MDIRSQISMVFHLDKCIGCHTCSIACKNIWTDRKGAEYQWWNNVETKPGTGYPSKWEDQDIYKGGWEKKGNGAANGSQSSNGSGNVTEHTIKLKGAGKVKGLGNIFHNPNLPVIDDYYEPFTYKYLDLIEAKAGDEDIHTANERRLTELIGDVAGKLHTGRSRNDQVATDTRMWLRKELMRLRGYLRTLIEVAVDRAEREVDVVMPGFTHLQSAQTVRWSHWLLSHAAAWQRDDQRLGDLIKRVNVMPLGSGALAGNPFGIDRQLLAKDLEFDGVCPNSMDAVSDRDYIAEASFWASMTATHLSRWSEDLIVYCSQQFGMVKCSDAYSTGSSLMPQKKNPDALELLRGKTGTQLGSLMAVLATIKGTPTTYNKDLQEVWHAMYYTVDNMSDSLQISAGCLATLKIYPDAMERGLCAEMLATDLAEYLVRKGVPFRETHHISGAAVKLSEDRGVPLSSLTVDDLKPLCAAFESDVDDIWSYEKSAESRDTEGGTSRRSVLEQCAKLRAYLAENP